ncbi:aminoglycoside adenylyltransferase domain-containing protein [Actinopolymorpha sp. B11F2]|uniref:aminoglycoside adenylyltransferase domain-containing protein n=1 Tax=Actinopolymorpha sp. B11F2 TaxID=3160862 RepID=UPI0032E4D8E7
MTINDAELERRLAEVGEPAKSASVRLARGIGDLLGDNLVAMWLYGGQLAPGGSPGDVDLHVVVRRAPDSHELERVNKLHSTICSDLAISQLDAWYVLLDEARSSRRPRDLNWPAEERDENWAIKRAQWFAGAYVLVHGLPPEQVVPRPDRAEIEAELVAQLTDAIAIDDHRHPAGLTLRLCRVLLSLTTQNVVHFKLDAAAWALDKLSPESRAHVAAAVRVYRCVPAPGDRSLIAERVSAFCREICSLVESLPGR